MRYDIFRRIGTPEDIRFENDPFTAFGEVPRTTKQSNAALYCGIDDFLLI
jgi:hypothetical protein